MRLTSDEGVHDEEHGDKERDDDEVPDDPTVALGKCKLALVRGGFLPFSDIFLGSFIFVPAVNVLSERNLSHAL